MADGTVQLDMTSNAASFIRALQDAQKGLEELAKRVENVGKRTKDSDRDLERYAERMKTLTATPYEKLQMQIEKLTKARDADKISQEEYERVVERLKAKHESLGQTTKQTFSLASISKWTGGLLAASAIMSQMVNFAKSLTTDMETLGGQIKDSGKHRGMVVSQMGLGSIQQSKAVEELITAYEAAALLEREPAQALAMSTLSAGLSSPEDQQAVATVARYGIFDDMPQVIGTVGKIRQAYTVAGKDISTDQIFRAMLGASYASPYFATTLGKASVGGALVGAGPLNVPLENVLAATAQTAQTTRTPELSATQVEKMFQSLEKMYAGKGMTFEQMITDAYSRTGGSLERGKTVLGSEPAAIALRAIYGGMQAPDSAYNVALQKMQEQANVPLVRYAKSAMEVSPEAALSYRQRMADTELRMTLKREELGASQLNASEKELQAWATSNFGYGGGKAAQWGFKAGRIAWNGLNALWRMNPQIASLGQTTGEEDMSLLLLRGEQDALMREWIATSKDQHEENMDMIRSGRINVSQTPGE